MQQISEMQTYVHGYAAGESLRLQDQARTLAELLHGDTAFPPGSRVLEAGCGTGAQSLTLARNSPGARITALDRSAASLAEAERRAAAAGLADMTFVQADILDLPFPPGSFDHVFVCFVLEHLAQPVEALVRLRRVLKPSGTITVVEGDHGTVCFHPESAAARDAIRCQVDLQRMAGGDALIGRRLQPLLRQAGFAPVRVSPRLVYADSTRPDLVEGFTRQTFIAMIRGVREPALAAGLSDARGFEAGLAALERTAGADGVFCYTFFKAVGFKAMAVRPAE